MARLSTDLGMSVVVEGIETNEQLDLISADGTISEAQGYLFSRPLPSGELRELIDIPASDIRVSATPTLPAGTELRRVDVILRVSRSQ